MAVNANYSGMEGHCGPDMQKIVSDLFKMNLGMTHTFKKGDNSNLVYMLQAALYLKGYNLNLNSVFDDATEAAVRAYQRSQGLTETGVVNSSLLRRLFPASPTAPMPMPLPAPQPTMPMPLPAPAPQPTMPMPLPAPMPQPTTPAPLPAPAPQPQRPQPRTMAVPASAMASAEAAAAPTSFRPPVPNRPGQPGRPSEYNIRLNPRNPEATINVKYDR